SSSSSSSSSSSLPSSTSPATSSSARPCSPGGPLCLTGGSPPCSCHSINRLNGPSRTLSSLKLPVSATFPSTPRTMTLSLLSIREIGDEYAVCLSCCSDDFRTCGSWLTVCYVVCDCSRE